MNDLVVKIRFEQWMIAALLLFFSCAFFYAHGSSDVDRFWLAWMEIMSGYDNFREGFSAVTTGADYPPLSLFILYIIKNFSLAWNLQVFLVLKFVLLVFLFFTTTVFYFLTKDFYAAVLVHLMMLLSGVMLSYLDVFYAPFLLLSLWALKEEKFMAAVAWFCICCSLKYQPLIIGPFYAVYLWRIWRVNGGVEVFGVRAVWLPVAAYLVAMLAWVQKDFILSFYNGLLHSRLSFQGLNAYWAYMQFRVMLGAEEQTVRGASEIILYGSRVAFAAVYCALLWRFVCLKTFNYSIFLLFALAGFYSYFVVISGVHENHLFVAVIVAVALYVQDEKYRALALFVFLMNLINLLMFNGLTGNGLEFEPEFGIDMTIPMAIVNTIFYGWFVCALMGLTSRTDYCSGK